MAYIVPRGKAKNDRGKKRRGLVTAIMHGAPHLTTSLAENLSENPTRTSQYLKPSRKLSGGPAAVHVTTSSDQKECGRGRKKKHGGARHGGLLQFLKDLLSTLEAKQTKLVKDSVNGEKVVA